MKLGFLYAGQGSQHPGMGQDLYETYPAFREVLDRAETDFDLKALCFQGPEKQLNQTRYTQPCMVAFAAGLTAVLKEMGIVPDLVAGLSLGEYSALAAAGGLETQTAISLAACQTGGEKEIQELKATLEAQGIEVVATVLPDECCHKMLVRKDTKVIRDSGAEAVVCMACGDGVQTVADNLTLPVYPSNNTMFLGQVERVGIFHEYCRMCGDCVLGSTGGICPITKCAKSLVNGPCGGQKNGKCEANPENDCAWIQIYNRLVAIGQEDKLLNARTDKGYANAVYPKHVNLRGKKV